MSALSSRELLLQDWAVLPIVGFYALVVLLLAAIEPEAMGGTGAFIVTLFIVMVFIKLSSRKKYLRCPLCRHTVSGSESK